MYILEIRSFATCRHFGNLLCVLLAKLAKVHALSRQAEAWFICSWYAVATIDLGRYKCILHEARLGTAQAARNTNDLRR